VRFLTDKLQSYGGVGEIPQQIVKEIEQTDQKIAKLEELLYSKRSKQMAKMKKKVKKFVETLSFELSDDDLSKIDDEVGLIFFLIDIFTERYNELTSERVHTEHLLSTLKEDTLSKEKLWEENNALKDRNNEQHRHIRELELEVFNLRKDTQNWIKSNLSKEGLAKLYL
jgi:ferritin-like metal-binding protein YciE